MKNKGYNLILKNKRESLHLSLKEAAAKLNIFALTLKLYEEGYLLVNPKYYERFISLYNLRDDFFTNDLLYPTEVTKELENKHALQKLSHNIFFRLVCLILIGGSIALICVGNNEINYSTNNPLTYYSDEILKTRENVLTYGVSPNDFETTDSKNKAKDFSLYKAIIKNYTNEDNENYHIALNFSSIEGYIRSPYFEIEYYDKLGNTISSFELTSAYGGVYATIWDGPSSATAQFNINDTKYRIVYVYDSDGNELNESDPDYYILAGIGLKNLKDSEPYINNLIDYCLNYEYYNGIGEKPTEYIPDYEIANLFLDAESGSKNYDKSFGRGSQNLIFGGILLGISTFLLIFALIVLINDHHLLKVDINKDHIHISNNDENFESKKQKFLPLKPNIRFPFFIPETAFRYLIIGLLLASSLATFYFFKMCLGFVGIGEPLTYELNKITSITNFFTIASNFVCIATMLHMLIRIDMFIETKGYIKNAILMFFLGLLFYIFEVLLVYTAQSGLNNLAVVASLIGNYLPGNIFWGMGVYALFALFLFARPKLFSKNKKLSVLWKLFIIIPLFYLIISMVYSCLVNAKVWSPLPFYVSFLMFPKGLCITIIVCAFCLFVKYFRTIAIVLLGHKSAETFFKGNQYILAKNITACILILLVGIVDLILHYTVSSDNVYMKALNLGNNFYILAAIPLVLFYRPHFGVREQKSDMLYSILYGVSFALSFILIGFLVLPYVSYLQPFIDFLLS